MIETVRAQFPQVGETRIRKMLNVANDKFIDKTRIVQDVAYINSVRGQLYYHFKDFNNSNGGDLRQITNVKVEDHEDTPHLVYWAEDVDQRIGVGLERGFHGKVKPLSRDGLTIQINGVYGDPGYGVDLQDGPAYDSAFHMGIVYDVLNDLHSEKGNIQMSQHYHNKYR